MAPEHVAGDGHFLIAQAATTSLVVVEKTIGLWHGSILEKIEMAQSGCPIAMWCLVLAHEEKRLIAGACVFQPIERLIGDEIGAVAIVLARAVFGDELGLVVVALAGENAPVVEALRLADEVPFADEGGLVASGL